MVVRGLHENRVAAEIIDPTKKSLSPGFSYVHQIVPFPSKLAEFPTKISFAMPIIKARGQTLKCVKINETSPGFSIARCALNFPEFFT